MICASPAAFARPRAPSRRGRLARIVAVVALWRERSRARDALATLSDRELRDIGISRCEVFAETQKPFWRR